MWASYRVTASFGHLPAAVFGPPSGAQLPHHWLQGNFCSGAWSSSSASFCTDLGVSVMCSLYWLHLPLCPVSPRPSLLNTLSQRWDKCQRCCHCFDGLSLGLWWVPLGAAWHWICQTQWKFLAASHRSHPCSPPLPKACHANPI